MTYCLMTEDRKIRVEIRCILANKPENLIELVTGINAGTIELLKPKSIVTAFSKRPEGKNDEPLYTDWERTGISARNINWIRIEDL